MKTKNLNYLKENQIQLITRILGTFAFIYIILLTSWISDDAQITFRTILNFVSGLGITFNYGERVQAFTHPLWFFVLSSVIAITRELYVTTQIVSIIISLVAIIVFSKMELTLGKKNLLLVSPLFYLIFSWAFCDYLTSGLENPLSYLLISLLLYFLFHANLEKYVARIYIILSLIVLNRYDLGLIFLPLALVLMYTYVNKKNFLNKLWGGVLILLIWVTFSIIYFGTPFPNTFFAKLNADYPLIEVYNRGVNYYKSLLLDLNSIIILILGFLSLILYRDRFTVSLLVGKLMYLYYILHVGGDFMLGRFFSVIIFISIGEFIFTIYKCRLSTKHKNFMVSSLLIIIICISIPYNAPIYSNTTLYRTSRL